MIYDIKYNRPTFTPYTKGYVRYKKPELTNEQFEAQRIIDLRNKSTQNEFNEWIDRLYDSVKSPQITITSQITKPHNSPESI